MPAPRDRQPGAAPAPGCLGIDIGGTKVALRAESDDGRTEESSFRWGPHRDADRDLADLAAHLKEFPGRTDVRAVGVAVPATVGPGERITAWPSRPAWTGLALGPALRALFPGAAVAWADDGDLGALAEADAAGCRDLLYIGVGTGVGGGCVLGGALCPGPARGSFEIGHLVVDQDGPECVCGRRGCLQATASGPATLARAATLRGAPVGHDELRDGLRDRRPWAEAALDRTARALATAVTGAAELLHPERALLGGGFAAGVPALLPAVTTHLTALSRPGHPPPPLAAARLGGLSSLRGALLLAQRLRHPDADARRG
ncbi:ROK family protein [Streptomyces sp. NPDC013455]|uniref:ROK family protein n=1 Tax=Streptomyces sp. NPDC013455 TaxID=3155605 RepID=UPI00340EB574